MEWWLWVLVAGVGGLVLLGLIAWAIGRSLSPDHVTEASVALKQKPETVYALIADVGGYPKWSKIEKVTRLDDQPGMERWRQHFGRNSVVTTTTMNQPPKVYQQTIADDAKFFSGTWTYSIAPTAQGCRVTLTEHGKVHHAIPRFMMRFLVDPAMYLKGQLRAMAKHFGEQADIEVSPRKG